MNIANIINLNDTTKTNKNTILTIVLFLYLFIANNCTKNLFSGQLTEFICDNRAAQHIIAFITVLVLITYLGNVSSNINILCYSVLIYSWFILTTKLDLSWNLIIILLLVIAFFYQNKINVNEDINDDPSLSKQVKKKIINNNNRKKKYFVLGILLISIIGSTMYGVRKYNQYGGSFDLTKFMFSAGLKNGLKN